MNWKPEYATGINNLDSQHRRILEIITRFESLDEGQTHWRQAHPLVVHTRKFMEFHFCVEESLMRLLPYPELSVHRAEHQNVLSRIAEIERRALRENIRDWLVPPIRNLLFGHITGSDQEFAQCARNIFRNRPRRMRNKSAPESRG